MSDLPPPPSEPPRPPTPPGGPPPGDPGGPSPQDAPPPGYEGTPPYGAQAPYGAAPYPQQYGGRPAGIVPQSLDEIYYKHWLNILLYTVTCGIWGAVWAYRTHDDLQKYNGDGLGGIFGLIMGLLVSVVVMFTIPMEVERMYQRDGRQSPVRTIDGLWFLLPIVGQFIWYFKTQDALNAFWVSKGARPAG